jgi:hypothetical protein
MAEYLFHIRSFVPQAQGEELKQRVALLKARDYAAGLMGKACCGAARDYAGDAHHVAGVFVFADVPPARLTIAVALCRNLVHAAMLSDQLHDGETRYG